jgi:hypothetical protein
MADTVGRHGVLFLRKYTKFKFNFVLQISLKYLYEYINMKRSRILFFKKRLNKWHWVRYYNFRKSKVYQ